MYEKIINTANFHDNLVYADFQFKCLGLGLMPVSKRQMAITNYFAFGYFMCKPNISQTTGQILIKLAESDH